MERYDVQVVHVINYRRKFVSCVKCGNRKKRYGCACIRLGIRMKDNKSPELKITKQYMEGWGSMSIFTIV